MDYEIGERCLEITLCSLYSPTIYPLAHNQTTILIVESEKCTTDHKSEEDERLKRQRGGDGARAGDGQWQ